MPRAPSHVKETIAARAFEHALHPNLLTHTVRQGADYGIDYWVNVFGEDGELDRTFAVQLKYVDPDDVTHTPRDQEQPVLDEWRILTRYEHHGPCLARIPLPKQRLREYLDRAKTPAEVLLVAANDEDFFYTWLSDLDAYFLRWIPEVLAGEGSLTILLNSVRGEWSGEPAMLRLRERSLGTGKWLDASVRPGTIDSIANVAATAYVQTADARSRHRRPVDVAGLWTFLQAAEHPEIPLLFGRQLALLSSTDTMAQWAIRALQALDSVFAVPLACYVLAGARNKHLVSAGLDVLDEIERKASYYSAHVRRQLDAGYLSDYPYLDHEYICATAAFLSNAIERFRFERAQRMLVDAFGAFPQRLPAPNFYATRLQHLARVKHLLPGKSLDQLRRWCGFPPRASGRAIADAIAVTDRKWSDEWQDAR